MESKFSLEKVLQDMSGGNKLALEQLFDHFYPRLYNFSRAFLKLEDGIDDILQEVFIRIWQNRNNINNAATFNSYIFTITKNILLNELRSRLNDQKFKDRLFKKSVAEEYHLSERLEFDEMKHFVEQAIVDLPSRHQEVFRLSRSEGLSHRDIAEKLAMSEKNVEYHIHQSILFIKKRLKSLGLFSLLYFYLFW
jgi:RNA polymerase sigma-70 factor, ECF subfamily